MFFFGKAKIICQKYITTYCKKTNILLQESLQIAGMIYLFRCFKICGLNIAIQAGNRKYGDRERERKL